MPEPPGAVAIAKQPVSNGAPAMPANALAVMVRKNKLDEDGHPIPYEWVISIQARNAPLLPVWDAFDALMNENLGSRGETRKTVKTADVVAGRSLVTLDLVDVTPTAVLQIFESIHGGPRHPAPAGQGVELPAGFSLVKRTDSRGVPRFDLSLKRISRRFLGMWMDGARKEARDTARPENACLSAQADDIYPGPKVDAVFTNVTLAELEKGVEALLKDR